MIRQKSPCLEQGPFAIYLLFKYVSVGKAIAITYIRGQNILLLYETWFSYSASNSESSID